VTAAEPSAPASRADKSRRRAKLPLIGAAMLTAACALALTDAVSTYFVLTTGVGYEENSIIRALVDRYPICLIFGVVLLLAPMFFLPELPRLTVAVGFIAGNGLCAANNVMLLTLNRAPVLENISVWTIMALAGGLAAAFFVVMKLTALRSQPLGRSLAWLGAYLLYSGAGHFLVWLIGNCLENR
jgi:hypothetical protein